MTALQKSDGQHLQGWRLSAGDECRVMDGSSQPLVDVKCGGMSGRTVKQGEEIARLIAAAPELANDGRELLDLLCTVAPQYAESTIAANFRVTLAKATGQ